ncbi:MAG: hypothetical protein Kilf2KO_32490 [Rhodospirillales bacterium]
MDYLWPALALVLVIEGIAIALLPGRLGELLRVLEAQPHDRLRQFGLGAASIGALLYWLLT